MKNIHFRHAAAAVLAGMVFLAGQPFAANTSAAEPQHIVVIGDGISSGAMLSDHSMSYASLVGRYYGAQVTDLSKDACTTTELLTELDDPTVQAALADADMILFTVGIQDITDPFFEQLASYQQELGFSNISEMYSAKRSDIALSDDTLSEYSLTLQNKLESNEISCRDNILKIGEKLSAYADAEIICPNVYNCLNCIDFTGMSAKRQSAYKSIMNPGGWVLTDSVNVAYDTLAKTYGFTVIDTYNGFLGKAYEYTNLLQMDENPTEKGHLWIAQQITGSSLEELPTEAETLGDMNGDNEVNASDASEILIGAARMGAGDMTVLTPAFLAHGDVNKDNSVDAADASAILQYAAAAGAGSTLSPEAYFRTMA